MAEETKPETSGPIARATTTAGALFMLVMLIPVVAAGGFLIYLFAKVFMLNKGW